MKLLIIAGPYEADRIRRAAVAAGVEAVAVEPGESLSGWITASRPDLIVLSPQVVMADDPIAALGKVRAVPAGRVPTFLLGDAGDRERMGALADGFFVRPISSDELIASARARLSSAAAVVADLGGPAPMGARALALRPLVAQPAAAATGPATRAGADGAALLRRLSERIDAALDAEMQDAVRAVGSYRKPDAVSRAARFDHRPPASTSVSTLAYAPASTSAEAAHEAREAAAEFAPESSPKTVEAPVALVAKILATQASAAPADATFETKAGSLIDDDVPGLLSAIYAEGFSGHLTLRRGDAEKIVFFDGGYPVVATSNVPYDRMADMLFREGKISREQHARSREIVADTGRRMGAVLVDLGFLKASELFSAVRRHYEEVVFSLFAWETGDWKIGAGDPPPTEKIRLGRHPAALIMEGLRRRYALDRLLARVGPPATVLKLMDSPGTSELLSDIELTEIEHRLVPLFDGVRPLEEVRRVAAVSEEVAYQIARGLLALRVLIPVRRPTDGEPAEPPSASRRERDRAIDRERVLSRHALCVEGDYFQILGVSRDAAAHEIRRAHQVVTEEHSPDAFDAELAAELGAELATIRQVLRESLRVLGDDNLRIRYRSHLRNP